MFKTLTKNSNEKRSENFNFLKSWLREPKTVGSVWPTSNHMARRMASVINVDSGLPVLEIGPGTGTITSAILNTGLPAEKLFAVEFTQDFVDQLHIKFPNINVIQGDAYALDLTLGRHNKTKFDCAISALPLLYVPMATRVAFVEDVLTRLPLGRPLIQFSYGAFAPVLEKLGSFSVERYDYILKNFPPAQLWIYRRKTQ
jgi:phosphatidylethanolamine/phosphatidyl-N-methylethanolamine N-methyltransferase